MLQYQQPQNHPRVGRIWYFNAFPISTVAAITDFLGEKGLGLKGIKGSNSYTKYRATKKKGKVKKSIGYLR